MEDQKNIYNPSKRKVTKKNILSFLDYISEIITPTTTQTRICQYTGIPNSTMSDYWRKFPEIQNAINKVKIKKLIEVENKLYDMAQDKKYTEEQIGYEIKKGKNKNGENLYKKTPITVPVEKFIPANIGAVNKILNILDKKTFNEQIHIEDAKQENRIKLEEFKIKNNTKDNNVNITNNYGLDYQPSTNIEDYYHNDPRRPQLNPNLEDFWKNLQRNNFLYGGRGSGKTYDVAGNLVLKSLNKKLKILCVRFLQNKITNSVYSVLKSRAEEFKLQNKFKFTPTSHTGIKTENGSEYLFYGLSRNLDEVKGVDGVDILWIEEANFLTKEVWDLLIATIRSDDSYIIATWNPKYKSDFMQNIVKEPPAQTQVRKFNYKENPFATKTFLDVVKDMKLKDLMNYRHVFLGEPLGDDDRVFIRSDWIEASVGFEIKDNSGELITSLDVGAGRGGDNSALCVIYGSKIIRVEEWNNIDVLESTKKAVSIAQEEDSNLLVYDNIGIGEAVTAELKNHSLDAVGWNAGGSVFDPDADFDHNKTNRDHFVNIKAQSWQSLADRFYKTYLVVKNNAKYNNDELISISSDLDKKIIDKIIRELSAPHKKFNNNEQLKVESKEEMKKRGIPSPNIADTIVMAFAPDNASKNTKMW